MPFVIDITENAVYKTALKIGIKQGEKLGFQKGESKNLQENICKLFSAGLSPEFIANSLGIDIRFVDSTLQNAGLL